MGDKAEEDNPWKGKTCQQFRENRGGEEDQQKGKSMDGLHPSYMHKL